MKSKIVMLAVVTAASVGCQPIDRLTSQLPQKTSAQTVQQITFSDVTAKTQSDPLTGKVIAEMEGMFDQGLLRFPFVTADSKPIFVYEESNGSTKALMVQRDGNIKQEKFDGYKLKRTVLNNQILYIGYKNDSVIKLNTESFDYSEVNKAELDRSRAVADELKLPDKEHTVYSSEGYIYTEEGYIFDLKKHEYIGGDDKQKFYEKANFGYGSFLFEIEPRQDQAINLKVIKAKGDQTEKGKTYPIHLDLPSSYDVNNLEPAIGNDGVLNLFAPGVEEKGKYVIKLFQVPLGTFKE